MIVYKLDASGQEVWQYPAELTATLPNGVRLEAFFNREDKDYGWAVFKRNDRFVEYFYTDRWYNIFAIYDRDDGAHKGWYCNICRPAVVDWHPETAVACEDLALDLWVDVDGQTTILDEEEFAALDIPTADREQAQQALAHLITLAETGQLPL